MLYTDTSDNMQMSRNSAHLLSPTSAMLAAYVEKSTAVYSSESVGTTSRVSASHLHSMSPKSRSECHFWGSVHATCVQLLKPGHDIHKLRFIHTRRVIYSVTYSTRNVQRGPRAHSGGAYGCLTVSYLQGATSSLRSARQESYTRLAHAVARAPHALQ